jgi:hypothetical protein
MTFREIQTFAGTGEQVDGARLALSDEATSLQMAQARGTDARNKPGKDAAAPTQTSAPEGNDAGPLAGLLDPTGNGSPSRLFPEILKADEKWQKPYKELTQIDGHALLQRHDSAINKAGGALYEMPRDKADQMKSMADAYLDGTATPEQEKALATNSDFMDALKILRETYNNPNLRKAQELRASVEGKVGESILLRTNKAQDLAALPGYQVMTADKTSAKGNALGLIVESRELERYKRGGRI